MLAIIQMSISEFHNLKLMSPAWEGYSLEFECPLIWSINQIKCYVTYISPKMQFHQFEVTFAGKVLPGTMRLQELVESKREKDKTVLFLSSKPAEKFESYYLQRMEKFCNAVDKQFQQLRPNFVQSQLQGLPILNRNFDALVRIAATHFKGWQNDNQIPVQAAAAQPAARPVAADNLQQQDEAGLQFGTMAQLAILLFVVMTLWSQGSYAQIMCIGVLLLLHQVVGHRRRYRNNANNHNQNQNQQGVEERNQMVRRPRTPFERKVKLVYVTVKEFLYCYFMSLFPNWNLERDYLEKFKTQIEQDKKDTQEVQPQPQRPPQAQNPQPTQQPIPAQQPNRNE